jgi:hypothetical protein
VSEAAALQDPLAGPDEKPCHVVVLADGEAAGRMPYPGLRSFRSDEADLFFGREECVDAMISAMAASRFLAVLGSSGSGKSSLVRTGLLEALQLGFHPSGVARWNLADFAPGTAPLENLARAVLRANGDAAPADLEVESLRAFLKQGPRSLVEWAAANLRPDYNLLVIADQFEELFRFGDYTAKEEAEALVSLLIESSSAPGAPIHIVLTMRSEYLGACSLIPRLAEAISDALYLTPRMTRDDCAAAIEGPAGVIGFSIEPALVNRLLNDLTNLAPWEAQEGVGAAEQLSRQADQLPLMQHVLNRLYRRAAKPAAAGVPVVLTLADYDAMGGLAGAIDAHGAEIQDEITARLGEGAAIYVERIFRALVDGPALPLAVRRPASLSELAGIAGCSKDACTTIVEAFAGPGRNFLRTSRQIDPTDPDEVIVDISHESLIRQWSALARWFKREADSAANFRSLSRSSDRYQQGTGDILSGAALTFFSAWWESDKPTAAWAARYSAAPGDFGRVKTFLETGERERAAQLERERERARRERSSLRIGLGSVFTLLVMVLIGGAIAIWGILDQRNKALAAQRANFENVQALTTYADRSIALACTSGRFRQVSDQQGCIADVKGATSGNPPQTRNLPYSPYAGSPPPSAPGAKAG